MSEIIFVTPVFTETAKRECIGTLLLSTILKQKGIDVDIYRFYESDTSLEFDSFVDNSVNNLLSKKAKIISFYCRIDCFLANVIIAKKLKELSPETVIMFGGPQADVVAKETLEHFPWVDYCCSGEGETVIYPLVRSLLDGKDVSSVKGLTYRTPDGNIISNPVPDLICDLDTLPRIDYSSFVSKNLLNDVSALPIEVGRGCPFNCAYCSTSLFWQRKFRLKSPERILSEIKELYDNYGIKVFGFQHDLFTANKKLVSAFCKALNDSDMKIKWACSSRADTIDEDVIKEMAESGMQTIFLGIETGSPRMQELIHKKLNIEKTVSVVKHLVDNKILVRAAFMYGFPEETYDDIEQTFQLMYRLKKIGASIQLSLCSIVPGTEYSKLYKDEMVWSKTASNFVGDFGLEDNEDFVRQHQEVFSYFLELQSELRARLSGLDVIIHLVLELYDIIKTYDPDKAAESRILDLVLDFKEANAELLAEHQTLEFSNEKQSFAFCHEHKSEMLLNYLSATYTAEAVEIFKDILSFTEDLKKMQTDNESTADIKSYNININNVAKHKCIHDIEKKPCLVYFNKVNNQVSYVVKSLIN